MEQLEAEYKKIDAESPYGTVADELGESLGQDPQRIKCVRSFAPPHQQVADRQVALTHLRNLIRGLSLELLLWGCGLAGSRQRSGVGFAGEGRGRKR